MVEEAGRHVDPTPRPPPTWSKTGAGKGGEWAPCLSLPSCILITILGCLRELNCERPDACAMPALWLCGVRRSVVGPRPDAVVAGAATAGPGLMGIRVDSARRGCRVSRAAGWARSPEGPVITQRAADMDRPFFTPGGVVWAPAGVSVQRQRRPEDVTVCEVHSDIWGSRGGRCQ